MRLPKVLDSSRGWASFSYFEFKWAVQSRWRRLRGHHGAFEFGEVSARAADLTNLWELRWPGAGPLGHELRVRYNDQWTRFHSLPESKRYAESASEYDEILGRHHTVLRELRRTVDTAELHVIAEDWDWQDGAAGWSKRELAGAWPWRIHKDDDPDAGQTYFWAASGLSEPEMDALLLAAADDRADFIIGDPDLEWLYCPYDGGADVLLPSTTERDALQARHADWLSAHPDGL